LRELRAKDRESGDSYKGRVSEFAPFASFWDSEFNMFVEVVVGKNNPTKI
jgi:hypothetical protein